MARRTKQEALETRERILDVAASVFSEKGVSRTSLEDIARAAGFTRGAIYGHFRNKAEVFTAMINRIHLPLEGLVENNLELGHEEDPLKHLRQVLEQVIAEIAGNAYRRKVLGIMLHKFEWTDDMAAVKARKLEVTEEGRRCIIRLLSLAVTQGRLPANLDLERAERLLHASFLGLISDWLFVPQSFDLRQEGLALIDAYFDMIQQSNALRHPEGQHQLNRDSH